MSLPSIVSYGAAAKTSTLVWDSDLTIPDGYAIESASGEVGIVGDVSISGDANISGNITNPVYPSTVAGGDAPTVNSALVLTTTGSTREPVLWGYKGKVFVQCNNAPLLRGVDLDTGAHVTKRLANSQTDVVNMFIISIEGGSTNLFMQSPYNIII